MAFPQINNRAPEFTGTAVINEKFVEISSSQYRGKYLVLFFYPMNFTFVCPTELTMISDRINEFKKLNCEVIGISTDSQFSHLTWLQIPRQEGGLGHLEFPLLADKSGKISRAYGVFNEITGIDYRGQFIIDEKFKIRQITVNDLAVGRSIDETLRLLNAFQYSDFNGEACPANWKPGDKTIKPDPIESKLYFMSSNANNIPQTTSMLKDSTITNKVKSIDSETKTADDIISSIDNDTSLTDNTLSLSVTLPDRLGIFSQTNVDLPEQKELEELESSMSKLPTVISEAKKPKFKKAFENKSHVGTDKQ